MPGPLQAKRIVLTRSVAGNIAWGAHLQALGARIYSLPTIETVPLPLTPKVADVLKQFNSYDWLILTSATSVRYVLDLAHQADVSLMLTSIKVAAIGDKTAHAARQAGLNITFQPSQANSATLALELDIAHGSKILWPHARRASHTFATALQQRGADVTEFPLYETHLLDAPDKELSQLLKDGAADFLVFASPSAVEGFGRRLTGQNLRIARGLPAIAIGPEVATLLVGTGYIDVHTSDTPSIAGVTNVLKNLSGSSSN